MGNVKIKRNNFEEIKIASFQQFGDCRSISKPNQSILVILFISLNTIHRHIACLHCPSEVTYTIISLFFDVIVSVKIKFN